MERACAGRRGSGEQTPSPRLAGLAVSALVVAALAPLTAGRAFAAPDSQLQGAAPGQPPAWEPLLRVSLGSGYDDNVRQASRGAIDGPLTSSAAQAAAFVTAALALGAGREWRWLRLDAGYEVYQTAYPDRSLDSSSFNQHALDLRLSDAGRTALGWALGARGDLSFTGLDGGLRPFQRSGAAEGELVLRGGRWGRLRAGALLLVMQSLDPELAFLSGLRLETRLTPELLLGGWRMSFTARWRRDRLGSFRGDPIPADEAACPGCFSQAVSPASNQAWVAGLRIATPAGWPVRPGVAMRFEHRAYDEAEHQLMLGADGSQQAMHARFRTDQRIWVETTLRLALGAHCTLIGRFEVTESATRLQASADPGCPGGACAGDRQPVRGFRRQVAGVELELEWM
jgi:hypothetical protein